MKYITRTDGDSYKHVPLKPAFTVQATYKLIGRLMPRRFSEVHQASFGEGVEMIYKQYQRKQIAELGEWYEGFDMTGVSVSEPDRLNGSPKAGDMIARNPANHSDKWLVAARYFADNFEPVK